MNSSYNWQPQLLVLFDHPSSIMNTTSSIINSSSDETQPFIISPCLPKINKVNEDNLNCSVSNDSSFNRSENSYKNQSDNSNLTSSEYLNETQSFPESPNGSTHNQRRKFSPEEDIKLSSIIAIHGPRKWDQIALSLPGRTGRQCRDRFHNYLNPSLTNGPWTREEDRLLQQKVCEIGQHWNKIAKFFRGRSTNNIKNRWYTYICKQKDGQLRTLSGRNMHKNRQNYECKAKEDNASMSCAKSSINDVTQINNQNNFKNSCINYSNNELKSLPSFCEINCQNKQHEIKFENLNQNQFFDYSSNKPSNEKRKLFPPICPPNDNINWPSDQEIFNFLRINSKCENNIHGY